MKPDVIVAWPRSCDYPLWRRFITAERDRFARVIVAFTEHDGPDYRDFVRAALPFAECFDAPTSGEWRDAAVNAALDRSDAEWVWFTEQDFLITDPERFWPSVEYRCQLARATGWWEETGRWHPSCLFVRRDLIERTSRDFGPDPVDHFWTFSRELEEATRVVPLPPGWEHLAGLSHNHHLADAGAPPNYHRERFRAYLRDCLTVAPLDPRWVASAHRELAEG